MPRTILVVDDDGDLRDTLNCVLSDAGFRVIEAAHGREALSILQGGARPSAILLDLMMPVMSGQQFRALQRRDPELLRLPVVVMTASRRTDPTIAEMDPAATLHKPVDLETLLGVIERVLAAAGVDGVEAREDYAPSGAP